jgi:hypothetical protein
VELNRDSGFKRLTLREAVLIKQKYADRSDKRYYATYKAQLQVVFSHVD